MYTENVLKSIINSLRFQHFEQFHFAFFIYFIFLMTSYPKILKKKKKILLHLGFSFADFDSPDGTPKENLITL